MQPLPVSLCDRAPPGGPDMARHQRTLEREQEKQAKILAGLADLLELPPTTAHSDVLTALAEQLGCTVAPDGAIAVENASEPSDVDDDDDELAPQVDLHLLCDGMHVPTCSQATLHSSTAAAS